VNLDCSDAAFNMRVGAISDDPVNVIDQEKEVIEINDI
jgi:hypothetical protein